MPHGENGHFRRWASWHYIPKVLPLLKSCLPQTLPPKSLELATQPKRVTCICTRLLWKFLELWRQCLWRWNLGECFISNLWYTKPSAPKPTISLKGTYLCNLEIPWEIWEISRLHLEDGTPTGTLVSTEGETPLGNPPFHIYYFPHLNFSYSWPFPRCWWYRQAMAIPFWMSLTLKTWWGSAEIKSKIWQQVLSLVSGNGQLKLFTAWRSIIPPAQ